MVSIDNGVMLWPLQSPVHCEYFKLYNVTCLVVSCYGPTVSGTLWVLQFVQRNMLSGVMLWHLHPPVHCKYFSLSALSLGIGQTSMLDPLAGALSGIPELRYFWRTEMLWCVTFCLVNCFFTFNHVTDRKNRYCSWYLLCCLLTTPNGP